MSGDDLAVAVAVSALPSGGRCSAVRRRRRGVDSLSWEGQFSALMSSLNTLTLSLSLHSLSLTLHISLFNNTQCLLSMQTMLSLSFSLLLSLSSLSGCASHSLLCGGVAVTLSLTTLLNDNSLK